MRIDVIALVDIMRESEEGDHHGNREYESRTSMTAGNPHFCDGLQKCARSFGLSDEATYAPRLAAGGAHGSGTSSDLGGTVCSSRPRPQTGSGMQ
jgi:hypothetical protein